MKILVTGGNGQLAKAFTRISHPHTLILATKKILDVENKKDVFEKIAYFKPDIVFHFASLTRSDECAANPEKAKKINVDGTRYVASATKKNGIPIVFVSTNEVFDGKKQSPYTESDKPHPITVVGRTKLQAEKIITTLNKQHYIVRTMWLYSPWSRNFIHAIIEKSRKKKSIQLVYDEVGSPTNAYDLAQAILKLIKSGAYGTYHITNKGHASRFDFGTLVFSHLNINTKVDPVNLKDFNRLSIPPLYSALESEKIESIGIRMRTWKKALKDFLEKNKSYLNA